MEGAEPPPAQGPTASYRPASTPGSPIGSVIAGRYKVREEIGEGGMGTRLPRGADPTGEAEGGAEADPGGDGFGGRAGAIRVGAAGAGPDGPPEHRQGVRRRHDRVRPPLLRHGAGQGDPPDDLLRRAPPRPPRPAGAVPPDLLGGAARAPEGDHPPRPQALQHPGREPRRPSPSPR